MWVGRPTRGSHPTLSGVRTFRSSETSRVGAAETEAASCVPARR
jgi:hypothetical protein